MSSKLFEPLTLRGVTMRNRVWISPMCMYSARAGVPQPWHLVHLGARAAGGAGLVMAEATAVTPEGRISPSCPGLWNDAQAAAWKPIAAFIREHGAVAAIQLAHAGRKASTREPWFEQRGGVPEAEGGWTPVGVGEERFVPSHTAPRMLTTGEVAAHVGAWADAAVRAVAAGFQLIQLHAAHGYLFHQFLSPLSNHRTDEYGGSFENRVRFLMDTTRAVRAAVPDAVPLAVRLSTTDWVEGGWTVEDSVRLAVLLREAGVDIIDCSSGGATPDARIPVAPGFQVPNAARIRREASIATAAVGLISDPHEAERIIASGEADAVAIARASLDNPHWPIHAALHLGHPSAPWPKQYAWVNFEHLREVGG